MAVNRYYSSTATATTLSSGINNSVTSMVVASVTGFPVSYPYTLILDEGTASEEAMTVTAGSGTTLTVTRGVDGTTGVTHSSGASVIHGVTARDYREPQEHIADATLHLTSSEKTAVTAAAADWTSFTPTWTTSGTAPAIGNGTLIGRYNRVGDTVNFEILLEAGSTTTFGTSAWRFALPAGTGTQRAVFAALANDTSEGTPFVMAGWASGLDTTLRVAGAGAFTSSTYPFSWQTGDSLQITGSYEAA